MSTPDPTATTRATDVLVLIARCLLGGVFIYMGLHKALHPVEFLKLVRQYEVVHPHLMLNMIASTLPWFEIFCGLLLMFGIGVRGTAVMLVAMLIPFTLIVFLRALAMRESGGLPFCAIKFDCGCGAGEVIICRKLAENTLLTLLSAALIFWRRDRLCLRHTLFQTTSAGDEVTSL